MNNIMDINKIMDINEKFDIDIDINKLKNKTAEMTSKKNFYLFILFFIMLIILLITFKFKLN